MKITINPANTNLSIQVEGTQEELAALINVLTQKALSPSSVNVAPVQRTIPAELPVQPVPLAKEFLDSIFTYTASKDSIHGRGRYIADLLATGNTYTYKVLLDRSQASRHTLRSTIMRMEDAGAIFITANETIRLQSVPNKKYTARKRRTISSVPTSSVSSKTKRKDAISASLTGKKIR